MEVGYCPTENMLGDILSKLKQGKVFREFIGQLMDVEVDYHDKTESKNTSERIVAVLSEEDNEFNTVQKRLIQ